MKIEINRREKKSVFQKKAQKKIFGFVGFYKLMPAISVQQKGSEIEKNTSEDYLVKSIL